jgi:hypothetical protein
MATSKRLVSSSPFYSFHSWAVHRPPSKRAPRSCEAVPGKERLSSWFIPSFFCQGQECVRVILPVGKQNTTDIQK